MRRRRRPPPPPRPPAPRARPPRPPPPPRPPRPPRRRERRPRSRPENPRNRPPAGRASEAVGDHYGRPEVLATDLRHPEAPVGSGTDGGGAPGRREIWSQEQARVLESAVHPSKLPSAGTRAAGPAPGG